MKIKHISDCHSSLSPLTGKFDVIINSGDFYPNSRFAMEKNKIAEAHFQYTWLENKLPLIKNWIGNHPYFFINGNHDYVDGDRVELILRQAGINAFNIEEKIVSYQGINFYGFSYMPYYYGGWNYEVHLPEMKQHMAKLVEQLNKTYVDVLVCHVPPHQILDLTHGNVNIGNTCLNDALNYQIEKEMLPQIVLVGHCHENSGISIQNNILFVNSACTQHIIDYF